jgi:twinkle protein
LPWDKAKHKALLRPAEVTIVSGINGHGKSILTTQIACDAMEQGYRVCIASMEMQPRLTLQRMIRQAEGHNGTAHTPSIPFIREAQSWFAGKLWLFNVTGTAKANRMLEVFDYARRRYGIDLFIVDSLAKCGMAEDDWNAQKAFVEALADFKNEQSVHVLLVSHPRKGENEEQQPGKMDVRGGQAITDLVDNGCTLWRNKKKQKVLDKPEKDRTDAEIKELEKPDAFLTWWKQRNGEWEGRLGLWWRGSALQFVGTENARPTVYVEYSGADRAAGVA